MKYCPEIVKEIADHVRQGRTQKDAAILSNISEKTFYNWIDTYSNFSQELKKAQSEFKKQLEIRIQKASGTTWQAAAWMLERRCKEDYSLRTEHTDKDGEALFSQIVITIKGAKSSLLENGTAIES